MSYQHNITPGVLYTSKLFLLILIRIVSAEYSFEVFQVERCPLSKQEWESASDRLSCNKSHGYHCVPNKRLTSLIEFCYPLGYKKPFHEGNCLELAADGILNHVHCNTTFACGCPNGFYFSNEIYKFPMCLSINPLLQCFNADFTCMRLRSLEVEVTTTKPHSTSVKGKGDDESMTSVSNVLKVFQTAPEHGCHPGYIVALVLCIIFFITTSALAVALCCEKRKKRKLIGINKAGGYENVLLNPTNKEELSLSNQECQKASFQEKSIYSKDPHLERTSGLQIRGFNSLHLAAKVGNYEEFKQKWEEFSSVENRDLRTRDGRNCLHIAAYFGHLDICEHILRENKTLFSSKDNNKMNPAQWAALGGKKGVLDLMLEYGCDLEEKTDPYEENIVLFACIGNSLEVCEFAERNFPTLLHAKNREGWNPIQYAAKSGYLEIFNFLYYNKVNCKSKSDKTGKNCLHSACENGHMDICKYILSKEPDLISDRDINKQHVGHFAAKSGNSEILSALLTKTDKHFLKMASKDNINILHVACRYANLEFCKQLKELGILYDLCQETTEKGWNAALFITERSVDEDKRIKILELLVEDNLLDVYHVSRAGKTILYNACVNQSMELVTYLLDHYPDLIGIERALDPKQATKSQEISDIFEKRLRTEKSKRDSDASGEK
uniref:Serine/threonine-protein phosphatase 6 regulatory ankyrin repeat subunit C-like n=1 Tax=Crassostrea virginica TaxID=6565 RepID=A0A8B8BEA4_CRAVI|nr:serine/threonine-protein phosphatase 6 regulatory ankyrin repeat subunit C-like [Crassostrea virginica]